MTKGISGRKIADTVLPKIVRPLDGEIGLTAMALTIEDDRGLFEALIGDGRPLLMVTSLSLVLVGGFALFLAATGHFLPHDVQFLEMTATDLCALHGCRIVHFMVHDRVSFGGSLIAVGAMYAWLAEFPLRRGEAWAWWLFVVSGVIGFGSFMAYLGYGYLDTWHGVATLFLLPCFVGGLVVSYRRLPKPTGAGTLLRTSVAVPWRSALGFGRLCLLATAAGMVAGGLTIMIVGMTSVFVPQDLSFMQLAVTDLQAINPKLMPLIAHDRAGFGGGICACGITVLFAVWCGRPSRSLWQSLFVAGSVGFSAAIGVHPLVGYVDFSHLAPAILGAIAFSVGLTLSFNPMFFASRQTTGE